MQRRKMGIYFGIGLTGSLVGCRPSNAELDMTERFSSSSNNVRKIFQILTVDLLAGNRKSNNQVCYKRLGLQQSER